MDGLRGYHSENGGKGGGTGEVWRATEKGHGVVERGDKTGYEVGKAIIQGVAERSNPTERGTVSVSQGCTQTRYRTGQRKGMARVW